MKKSKPHDGLVKAILSDLSMAKEILQRHLPASIVEKIKWETLELANKSFVDKKLRQYHGDIFYKFKVGDQDAYASIEHLSSGDVLLPFRQFVYNVLAMYQHVSNARTGDKYPPLVFNICIYAGPKSPYPYSFDLFDCFKDPDLARQVLFKPASALDLTTIPEKDLAVYKDLDVYLHLLKQAVHKKFLNWVENHIEEITKLYNSKYAEEGVFYMLKAEEEVEPEVLIEKLRSIVNDKNNITMSAAQKLIDRGVQIGEGKGVLTKSIEIARIMLQEKEPIEKIIKWTGLAKAEVEKILQGSR